MALEDITLKLRQTVRDGSLVRTRLPLVPEIRLHLLSEDYPRGPLDPDEMTAIMNAPAYWAFCWASGQVLARHVLDHPDRFAGRTVLDLGTGSGVVAIAAAMAGAAAIACDTDPVALQAAGTNAAENGTRLSLVDDLERLPVQPDIVLAADVLYDRDNLPLLARLPQLAPEVIIADSRVKQDRLAGYRVIARMTASTIPDLDELREFSNVRIYRADPVLPS